MWHYYIAWTHSESMWNSSLGFQMLKKLNKKAPYGTFLEMVQLYGLVRTCVHMEERRLRYESLLIL
jgi:hypothetical protein